MAVTTTVRLEAKTKTELDKFKNFGRESYSEVIERLIHIAKEDAPLSKSEIHQIESSLEDIKKGRVLSFKEAEKKWAI